MKNYIDKLFNKKVYGKIEKRRIKKEIMTLEGEQELNYGKIKKLKQVRLKSPRYDQDIDSLYRKNYQIGYKIGKLQRKL